MLCCFTAFSQKTKPNDQNSAVQEQIQPTPVEQAIGHLTDKESSSRRKAAAELGRMKDAKAAPALIKTLQDKDIFVRCAAIDALAALKNEKAGPELIKILETDDSPHARQNAAAALGSIGNKSCGKHLIKALDDKSPAVTIASLKSLAALRDKNAFKPASELLNSANSGIRRTAVSLLGELGGKDSADKLTPLLADNDYGIRHEAAKALGAIKDPSSIEPLKALLKDTVSTSSGTGSDIPDNSFSFPETAKSTQPKSDVISLPAIISDPQKKVKLEAALSLAGMNNDYGTAAAADLLKDPDIMIRRRARSGGRTSRYPQTGRSHGIRKRRLYSEYHGNRAE